MSEFEVLAVQLVTLWIVVAAIALIVRGPQVATTVATWPIRAAFRAVRWALGSAFVAIGNAIRGRPRGGQNHERRRR